MDLESLLTEAAPARRVSIDGPGSPAAERLYQRITSQAPGKAPARRRYLARGIAGVAIAGAAAIVAIAVIPGSPASPGHPDSAAAAVLEAAAVTASHQPATAAAGPGQYEYVKTIQSQRLAVGTGTKTKMSWQDCVDIQTVQDWAAPDGSGRETASAESPCGGVPTSQTFSKGQEIDGAVYADAADLPTAPAALEQFIVQHFEGGKSQAGATFDFAGTFLQSGAPPAVRVALYRLIESLPGVESLGSMTDKLGRHGIGVGYTTNGVRDVLIFDPSTSAVLEREGVVVDPAAVVTGPGQAPFHTGEVINYTVYVESGAVDSLTAVPGGSGD
jgi:hypothetical protein